MHDDGISDDPQMLFNWYLNSQTFSSHIILWSIYVGLNMIILMCVHHRFVQRRCCISWKIESWFKEKVWNYYLVVIFATTQACVIHVAWIFHALPHNLQRVRPTTTGSREWKHKSQGRIGLRLFSKLSKVFAGPLFSWATTLQTT